MTEFEKPGRVYAEIDCKNLLHNIRAIRALTGKAKLCLIVKADAYGHGAVGIAKAASGHCDQFAVACVDEGAELRAAGIKEPIIVLGSASPMEYETALLHDLTLTVFQKERAELLADTLRRMREKQKIEFQKAEFQESDFQEAPKADGSAGALEAHSKQDRKRNELKPTVLPAAAKIVLAVDTGMSRIGVTPDEKGLSVLQEITATEGIQLCGMFTHFAKADEADTEPARQQAERFLHFRRMAEAAGIDTGICHCANSAAIVRGIGEGFDMVRAGIILYGLSPSEETDCSALSLRPLLSLRARLSYIKEIEAGSEVSYGGIFCAQKRMCIGTVSAGYADGYPRSMNGKGGEVMIRGKRCPIIGRICMDQMMVDLSDLPEAEEGDIVTLFGRDRGEEISIEELCKKSGAYHYELICGIQRRVPRIYT